MPVPLAPYAAISSDDKTGLLIVITASTLTFALMSCIVRFYVRFFVAGPWKWDDGVLAAAMVVSCIQSAVLSLQMSRGFGSSAKLLTQDNLIQTAYANDIFYVVALFLSKCSTAFLFLRLTRGHGQSLAPWATISASAVWAVLAILLISIACSPGHVWTTLSEQCTNLFVRWQVICAIDIITEAALFGISIFLVIGLQMPLKLKLKVVGAFSIRLPVIIISAIRLHYLYLAVISDDPTLQGVFASIYTQVELNYSICGSSFACLGPFITPFSNDSRRNYRHTRYPHSMSFDKRGATDRELSLVNSSGNCTRWPSKHKLSLTSKSSITNNITSLYTAVGETPTTTNHDVSSENETSLGTPISSRPNTKQENNNTDWVHTEQRQSLETNDSQQTIFQRRMSWSMELTDGAPGDMDERPNAMSTIGVAV